MDLVRPLLGLLSLAYPFSFFRVFVVFCICQNYPVLANRKDFIIPEGPGNSREKEGRGGRNNE